MYAIFNREDMKGLKMNYIDHILSFLDYFTGLTWVDRDGNLRVIWDNEFFFRVLHNLEKKIKKKTGQTGLLNRARHKYGLEHHDFNNPPIIESECIVDEEKLTLFASGHVYLVHTKYFDRNPENMLSKISETLPENIKNFITDRQNILKENFPAPLPFLCGNLSICLATELLGYVYLTPDEKEYVYTIPIKTSDDKKFMRKVFNKMNILIGKKPVDKWQNQPAKEFRDKVARPFLRNRYFEYRESGSHSKESLKKAIEDIKREYPQWKDLWDSTGEESIMRNYIRKQS